MIDFSAALKALKDGKKVCRSGWNGKDMYLIYIRGSGTDDGPNTTSGDYQVNENLIDSEMERLPWIGMKTTDNKFVPWLASQTDLLANDWMAIFE